MAQQPQHPGEGKHIADRARERGQPRTRMDFLREVDYAGDIRLKRLYGIWLLALLSVQIVIVDVAFFLYGGVGREWNIQPIVMNFWISSTVVEVIGVVFVIARYLFPRRDDGGG